MATARNGLLALILIAAAMALLCVLAARPAGQPPALPQQLPRPAIMKAAQAGPLSGLELDVDGALPHALQRHGNVAYEILRRASSRQCVRVYLECGADPASPRDGAKGYMVCPLNDGVVGLVPFYVDALVGRLVAMTAFPVRPGYERYVAERDGCVPLEAILLLLEENGYDDQ